MNNIFYSNLEVKHLEELSIPRSIRYDLSKVPASGESWDKHKIILIIGSLKFLRIKTTTMSLKTLFTAKISSFKCIVEVFSINNF